MNRLKRVVVLVVGAVCQFKASAATYLLETESFDRWGDKSAWHLGFHGVPMDGKLLTTSAVL